MELRHLRYFVAVAEAGSLSEAAEKKLHTSQPSLSRQIRDMEYEVGVALFTRSATGVVMTAAGRAYLDHARIALAQVDAAREAARRAAQPAKRSFAVGFQTGVEIDWLPAVTKVLRDELRSLELNVSSDYSPDLADALMRGKIDAAFMRIEPEFPELTFVPVAQEALIVLMPSDHRLSALDEIDPHAFVGEIFISGSRKARVLRSVTEDFLKRSGVDITPTHGVDNIAVAITLVASTRGLSLMPAYAKNMLPWSVVSRPLKGEAPTIDLAVAYSKSNSSPILQLFLSKLGDLKEYAASAGGSD
jgi:LysR family transcriptional regulator, hca operon transcriptional activator